ncbi:MAG: hypothetical protein WCJ09_13055 [Planctomycetota bacterium]
MPRDWSFSVVSGEYKHEAAETAQSGKLALVVAGAGGAAEVQTNATSVSSGTVLECEAWVQTELVKDGEPFIYTKFSRDDTTDRSTMIRISPKPKEWHRIHFFSAAEQDSSAMLAIRLGGEGLVRIDDVSMRVASQLVPAGLTSARTFEDVNETGGLKDWKHVFKAKRGTHNVIKERESSIVRMEGTGGWSVLCTRRAITTKPAKIILQGAVRVKSGSGNLKIDYIKKGNCFSSTVSPPGQKDWTFLSVESDPSLVDQSDAICATLSAASDGEFSADFDSVDVFIQN